MEKLNILKHMVSSNKKKFHYTFKVMISLQDQIEKMLIPYLEQYEMPIKDKEAIHNWLHKSKKSHDEYQQMIEDGFKTLDLYF